MEKIKRISSELRDWIVNTLNSGMNPELIVDSMIKKGFDPRFSYTTLFQILRKESIKTIDQQQKPYMYELPPISQHGMSIRIDDREMKVLMKLEKPYVIYIDNVLSSEECNDLIRLSENRLVPSQVIDQKTGQVKVVPGRTSEGTIFAVNENAFISKIEKRVARITNYPMEHGEGLQVLHYKKGEEYKPHFDFFPHSNIDPTKGGQRVGTFLIYLNDVESGGETTFLKMGLSIIPKKGAALYFHYGNSQNQVDRLSLHSSIPVSLGEKWVATKWIRHGRIVE